MSCNFICVSNNNVSLLAIALAMSLWLQSRPGKYYCWLKLQVKWSNYHCEQHFIDKKWRLGILCGF